MANIIQETEDVEELKKHTPYIPLPHPKLNIVFL
jgi:hypothetical protein